MYEFTHTDRRTDTGRDIVASAMKEIATKTNIKIKETILLRPLPLPIVKRAIVKNKILKTGQKNFGCYKKGKEKVKQFHDINSNQFKANCSRFS